MSNRVSSGVLASLCLLVAAGCGASSNPATNHALRVMKTGSGTGRVTGGGLDCGETCSVTLPNGTTVLLTAAPTGTSTLTSWSGCDSTSGASCGVTLNGDRQVTVEFACSRQCATRSCGDDGCGGSCGTCPGGQTCSASGQCVACTPNCAGKTCGDNGCGGSCGTCATGQTCNASGQCVACTPSCTGKTCGGDGCGGSCGTCTAGQTCSAAGQCVCAPSCAGKSCGSDGCGGLCGTCPSGQTCSAAGQCVCTPNCAGRQCGPDPLCNASCGTCQTGQVCNVSGQCIVCTPNCTGRQCGPDPLCNASCGTCPTGQTCSAAGQCVCTPSCTGKVCGNDGCGGSCGTCAAGQTCSASGQCVVCTPDCTGRQCGPDPVCQTSCGTCTGTDQACDSSGRCVLVCPSGFGDCDANPTNGCETNLLTDTGNCGACSHVCALPHATPFCSGGACFLATCVQPWMNCDGDILNGCEANALTDLNNCGTCGNVCAAGQICTGGSGCATPPPTCSDGIKNGQETDVDCGGPNCPPCTSGKACVVNTDCDNAAHVYCTFPMGGNVGTCDCSPSWKNCDGNVSNGCETGVAYDSSNCGSCGHVCGAGTTCDGGVCIPIYDVTIWAWDAASGWVSERITLNSTDTGFDTPHTFTGLTYNNYFRVPSTSIHGTQFSSWDTGETTLYINVHSGGTHTARYGMYNVTIWAWDATTGWQAEPVQMDGTGQGPMTPHTFNDLMGVHTFTVPAMDRDGRPFSSWDTGETSTTLTIYATGGTYTARYGL